MSTIWRRLARSAVRLYPRLWRERYGSEVDALLEAEVPGPGAVADLALGAIRERSWVLGAVTWFLAVLARSLALVMFAKATIAVLAVLIFGPIETARIGVSWTEWASRRIFDFPYAATAGMPMWFFFSVQFSLPILLLLLLPSIRRRHPVIARVVFTAAFAGFSFWLGRVNEQFSMLVCGWLIAVKLFPLPSAGARHRLRNEVPILLPSNPPKSDDLQQSMVTS